MNPAELSDQEFRQIEQLKKVLSLYAEILKMEKLVEKIFEEDKCK